MHSILQLKLLYNVECYDSKITLNTMTTEVVSFDLVEKV